LLGCSDNDDVHSMEMRDSCNAPTLRTRWNICVKCYSLDQ
jgi:hypothetical protein